MKFSNFNMICEKKSKSFIKALLKGQIGPWGWHLTPVSLAQSG